MKVGLERGHRLRMEGDDVVDVEYAPDDDLVFGIEDHARAVVLVDHGTAHGWILTFSTNFCTATTILPWARCLINEQSNVLL
jgi:hypothetical protein